jgi:hypothetical protein
MKTEINTSTVSKILPNILGTLTKKKIIILIEAANAINGQDFGGVIADDGTLYGTDEGRVIEWRQFVQMKVKVGAISWGE